MKKSKLRNQILRLLKEQINPVGNNGRKITMLPCPGNSSTSLNQIIWNSFTVNGNIPVVGDKVDLTNVPFISNAGYWKVTEVEPATASCTHPANQNGVCDLPTHNDPCETDPGTRLNCTEKDFQYNSAPCGQTHLGPAPGGAGSWSGWLQNQWNAYSTGVTQTGQTVGCFQFGAIITWITDQLNQGTNAAGVPFSATAIARKNAKRDWAVCMADHCKCDINTSWEDPRDPCKKLMADPMHSACCEKCKSGSVTSPTDPCFPHCECCDPERPPCPNGIISPGDPDYGFCLECFAGSPSPLTGPNCECCRRETQGGDERGCLDPSASNYMSCCPQNNYPGCVPTVPFDECCKYDRDPGGDNCKDNPNPECWICREPGTPCVTLASAGITPAAAMAAGMTAYDTQASCHASSECGPNRGTGDMKECHKCEGGYPVSNMFPATQGCPPGWQSMPPFDPSKCKPGRGGEFPTDPVDMVDPGIDRMRELMEYKKPK